MVSGFYRLSSGQRPFGSVKLLLASWLVSEILVFALVIKVLGFGGAVLLTAAVEPARRGVAAAARLEAAQQVRRAMAGGTPGDGALLDGTLAGFGAFLMIMPGFVTDLIGLALATPSVRQALLARFGASTLRPPSPERRNASPEVLDLSPGDWTVVEPPRRG